MTKTTHPCGHCGTSTDRPRYCGDRCNWAAKAARRYARDPQGENAKRAARLRGGEPVVQREQTCQQCAGDFTTTKTTQRYCTVRCRRRADRARQSAAAAGRVPPQMLWARGVGATRSTLRQVRVQPGGGGLWVFCPLCDWRSAPRRPGVLHERKCDPCDIEFDLNDEEAAWVASCAPPTTRQSA